MAKIENRRDYSIETFRCLLMFGICLLHAITVGPCNRPFVANILLSCVVGFVFISGWFGIKFTWMKLAKLYGIGLYCAMVYGLIASWGEANWLIAAPKLAWFKLTHGFWFLHAYALMMCLVPLVNVTQGGGTPCCRYLLWSGYGASVAHCRLSASFCRTLRDSMRMAGLRSSVSTWLRGGLG